MTTGRSPSSSFVDSHGGAVPLHIVASTDFDRFRSSLPEATQAYLQELRFSGKPGQAWMVPGALDERPLAVFFVDHLGQAFEYGALPSKLPPGKYRLATELSSDEATALCLGFCLGAYRFDSYKKSKLELPTLVWPKNADQRRVLLLSEAVYLARDLINTPASDMGPEELAKAAKRISSEHEAKCKITLGGELLRSNFPMIHAVGRASSRAPRLIDITWGKPKAPKLTLVGKGVCFDTGGLDLKPAQFMKLMKKDMGGAALVLGLAHAIMSQELPVRLRVLIPAVENSVSGDAMRPLDVLRSRSGLTVEIGDTDAEGRLILADALTEADSEVPDLIVDCATLTGAARTALGTQIPAVFASQKATWSMLEEAAEETLDPLWRLPLHRPYRNRLDSTVADLNNVGGDSYAGAITAALFLQEFVSSGRDWLHIDTMAYNLDARPGRPVGGEALGFFALESFLRRRYGHPSRPTSTGSADAKTAKKTETKARAAGDRVRAKSATSPKKAIKRR